MTNHKPLTIVFQSTKLNLQMRSLLEKEINDARRKQPAGDCGYRVSVTESGLCMYHQK